MMTYSRPTSNVSPAELIACLDAVPPNHAAPWVTLINRHLQMHNLSWHAAAVALQKEMEIAFEETRSISPQFWAGGFDPRRWGGSR